MKKLVYTAMVAGLFAGTAAFSQVDTLEEMREREAAAQEAKKDGAQGVAHKDTTRSRLRQQLMISKEKKEMPKDKAEMPQDLVAPAPMEPASDVPAADPVAAAPREEVKTTEEAQAE